MRSSTVITDFSAREPSLGYYYQFLYSLYLLLKSDNRNSKIRIECLDDIVLFDKDKVNLVQTKLHIRSNANLTDASPDFWKTIRVWVNNINAGTLDINDSTFSLITTEKVGAKSVLNSFVNKNDSTLFDTVEIIEKLNIIATDSNNTTNAKAYEDFLLFDNDLKIKLIERITIIDSSINTKEVIDEINKLLRFSITIDKVTLLSDRVIGQWTVLCVRHLLDEFESLSYIQIHNIITDLSESFKEDNLPDDFNEVIKISDEDLKTYELKTFIKQLEILSLKTNSIIVKNAISDFRRAYEQRSRWVRESLININDEENYNLKLVDEWNNLFAILDESCVSIVSEEELTKLSKEFYINLFVQNSPQVYIKKNFSSSYMIRGSYHMLADKKEIGWHINFKKLIK